MKKLFYLFMVTVCATMFTSCSKDDDKDPLDDNGGNGSKEGMITMVVDKEVEEIDMYVDTFNEGDIITIDWGDGKVEELKSFRYYDDDDSDYWWYGISNDDEYEDDVEHKYRSKNKSHTITIKGKIKRLSIDDNLISLDVSKCTALEELVCYYNNLTSLDVSKNTALKCLILEFNNLTSLDVSKCTALEELGCSCGNLTSLDVSGCTALEYLGCSENNLTSLDVSGCTALEYLRCSENNLTSLDVSGCTALEYLGCSENNLTSLDVSGCTALTKLHCSSNNFSASALNQIFKDLPQVKTWTDEDGYTQHSYIGIENNPGSATCDKSIATNKGWNVR